jgi:hypothetical protein
MSTESPLNHMPVSAGKPSSDGLFSALQGVFSLAQIFLFAGYEVLQKLCKKHILGRKTDCRV